MTARSGEPKREQAYRTLKDMILAGHFANGERITEVSAADRLGVSRATVREALLRLEADGLVSSRGARRGKFVDYLEEGDPVAVLCRYELREAVESTAARLAAKHMNGWQIDHLRELGERAMASREGAPRQERQEAGAAFRSYLIATCGNPLVQQVWETHRLMPGRPRTPEFEDRIQANLPEDAKGCPTCLDVVDAIAAHDQDRAEALVKHSVRAITEAIRKTLAEDSLA